MKDEDYIKELEGLICFLAGCYEVNKITYFDQHLKTCSVSNPNRRELTDAEKSEYMRFPLIQGSRLQNIVYNLYETKKPMPKKLEETLKRYNQ